MSAPDLLPCPFCGGRVFMHAGAQGVSFITCGQRDDGSDGCGAVVSFRPRLYGTAAAQAWGRRAPDRPSFDMDAAAEAAQDGWRLGEELGEDDTDKLWYAAVKAASRYLHDGSLRKGFERYEYVRTLAPIHFIALWERSIRGEGRFDDLVDAALRAEKEASSRE